MLKLTEKVGRMGVEPEAGQLSEPFRPRLGGRDSIQSAPDKDRGFTDVMLFFILGRPYAALAASFGRLTARCPSGRHNTDWSFLDNRIPKIKIIS